jgi:hypothetical protein
MSALTQPQVIFTHESDLDGLVAGLLLQKLAAHMFRIPVPVEAYHYQGWKSRSLDESIAWICDFVFEPRLDRTGWLVLDHHPTDFKARQARLIYDTTKSAALLCYELCAQYGLRSPKLDRLVHLTNVSDLFLENEPDFVLACDYANLVKTYGFWSLHALIGGELEQLIDHPLLEVMTVKRRIEDPLGYAYSKENIEELSPTVGLVRTVVGNTNTIVHQLLERGETSYSVLVTLFRKGPGTFIVSFRSRNGGALKVAAQLDGGGHPNAAGSVLPKSINDFESAAAYLRQRLQPQRATLNPFDDFGALLDQVKR